MDFAFSSQKTKTYLTHFFVVSWGAFSGDLHNPMLLEKIVRYFDIDDIASQFPKHLFDPEAIANRRSSQKKKPQGSPRAADAAPPA